MGPLVSLRLDNVYSQSKLTVLIKNKGKAEPSMAMLHAEPNNELRTLAVVLKAPGELELRHLPLAQPADTDLLVDMEWSGISTGTERLLWTGRMPFFPGMGYPLVPGYEGVGRVRAAGSQSGFQVGQRVFVPGARCFGDGVRGLFGSAASRVVVPAARVVALGEQQGAESLLLALAATALHALRAGAVAPQLIIGHGVLGRLLARLCARGAADAPTVWETVAARRDGASGYRVCAPAEDARRDYACICDVSGDASAIDTLIERLAPGGELVLAGFYAQPLAFQFAPAFMREACLRVAAQWRAEDLRDVQHMIEAGELSLDGLLTHSAAATDAAAAYEQAFADPGCLKMYLDWRHCQ